jgi:hypothetical protein
MAQNNAFVIAVEFDHHELCDLISTNALAIFL